VRRDGQGGTRNVPRNSSASVDRRNEEVKKQREERKKGRSRGKVIRLVRKGGVVQLQKYEGQALEKLAGEQ